MAYLSMNRVMNPGTSGRLSPWLISFDKLRMSGVTIPLMVSLSNHMSGMEVSPLWTPLFSRLLAKATAPDSFGRPDVSGLPQNDEMGRCDATHG